jgi:hypothetical protein
MFGPTGRDDYHHALGRFIDRFAKVEATAKELLYFTAGTGEDVSRVLFSGDRMDAIVTRIKKLRAVKNIPEDPILERAFGQLSIITAARNFLIHHEPHPEGATGVVNFSNKTSTVPGNEKEMTLTPEILETMVSDLWTISYALMHGEGGSDQFLKRASTAWRYKSLPPSQNHSPRRANHPKPPRPPKSSREKAE